MADAAATIQDQPRHEKRTKATARKQSTAAKPVALIDHPAESSGAPAIAQVGEETDRHQHVQGFPKPSTPGAEQLVSGALEEAGQQGVNAAQPAAIVQAPQDDPFETALQMLTQQGMHETQAKAALQTVPAAGKSLEECAKPPCAGMTTGKNIMIIEEACFGVCHASPSTIASETGRLQCTAVFKLGYCVQDMTLQLSRHAFNRMVFMQVGVGCNRVADSAG